LVRVELPPPSLADNSGDADRLLRGVKRRIGSDRIRLPLPLLRSLPAKLRKWRYDVQALCFCMDGQWHLINLFGAQMSTIVTGMELNVNQEFMNRFSAAKFLPHTDMSRFPSVLNTLNLRDKARPKIE